MTILLRSCLLKTQEKEHLLRAPGNQPVLHHSSLLPPNSRGASERQHCVSCDDRRDANMCEARPVVGRPVARRPAARRLATGWPAAGQPVAGYLTVGRPYHILPPTLSVNSLMIHHIPMPAAKTIDQTLQKSRSYVQDCGIPTVSEISTAPAQLQGLRIMRLLRHQQVELRSRPSLAMATSDNTVAKDGLTRPLAVKTARAVVARVAVVVIANVTAAIGIPCDVVSVT